MFQARPMSRILIAASKEQIDKVIGALYRQHLFHIEEFVEDRDEVYEGFRIGMPLPRAGEISTRLLKIRSMENIFSVDREEMEEPRRYRIEELASRIESELPQIEQQVEALVSERSKLESRMREYEQKIRELEPFSPVPFDLALLRDHDLFTVFAGHVPGDIKVPEPAEKFFSGEVPGNMLIVIVPSERADEVGRQLLEEHFQPIQIPDEDGSAGEHIDRYRAEIDRMGGEISRISERIDELKESHAGFLVACDELLTADVEQAEAPLRFAVTDEAFVVEGWVPTADLENVKHALFRATGGKIFVTEIPVDYEKESIPVEYENPSFARPTEFLIDLYARPRYRELDPTVMVAVVFPIFFGLILGDIGYGAVLLGLSLGLRKLMKGEDGKRLLAVLRNASIMSILFGALYSEFFGFALPWEPIIFSRHVNIGGHGGHGPQVAELLILAVWIAVLHISLGRIIGIFNARSLHHGKHATKAMIANAGWLGVLWGILLLIWSNVPMPLMPDFTVLPSLAMGFNATGILGGVLVVAGALAIAQESALELVELPTIVSHVLSYTRLVAVGLSSVAIAGVINYIAIGMMIEPQLAEISAVGIVFIIGGIAVLLVGHLLNTALGVLGGGLHSLRLHYIEFFTKFYKGGAKKYSPFGMKSRFTEEF
ncbi:MAG: V-type ATP synthase subunit I [Methanomicrobiaceae archaeon]|nr:V-type ATP synthase subunit I [Methanomicrobiaceae archaeon]